MTVPAVMRAVLLTGNGGFDRLELRNDVPVPIPQAGQVLIKVGAAGVNNTDINTRIGWYSKAVAEATEAGAAEGIAGAEDDGWSGAAFRFPRIQGADGCGRIVAVGPGVDPSRIGELVLVEPVFRGADPFDVVYFGSEVDGAFAEYSTAPSVHAHAIRSDLSDAELASFPCAYSAAENMLTRIGLDAGERVLITGASGGVGSAAVQLARRRGAQVIAMAGSDKAEAIRSLGAADVIARDADLASLFEHDPFDAAVDIVGGTKFAAILKSLRNGGRYAAAGAIAGPLVELDLRTLYLKDLRLIGCTVLEPEVFPNLIGYIERGEIVPLLSRTYPLSDIVRAQEDFLTKRHVGKIVLTL
ncbi:alcohol dehydrogenase family protein [Novosphingobium aquiterrae]|uniref:Alcohol dehydrogenase family protein n=1 Tax=Novosphingobium aquiterrae TaxID=624388 RepID=A0ABV6PNR6_9SPHN